MLLACFAAWHVGADVPQHRMTSAYPDADSEGPPIIPPVPTACADAVVDDDGSLENGYGWAPSVFEGIFVQEYSVDDFPSRRIDTVCVCWLRTRMDPDIDFEIVLYSDNTAEEMPQKYPYAAFPSQLTGVPMGLEGGTYQEVDLGGVEVPQEGRFFIGVRWDASVDDFFFICADQTERPEPPTRIYFRDDRFPAEWGVSDNTNAGIFDDHEALLLRPVPSPGVTPLPPTEVPLGRVVSAVLMAALLLAGGLLLRRS